MHLRLTHWIGIGASIFVLVINFLLFFREQGELFLFLLGVSIVILILPFIIALVVEGKRAQYINTMFLEFSRNLAESVNAGTPVSKSIINVRKKDYGPLSPHIEKLANQISVGIPVHKAMQTFAIEVNNPSISRAVSLISEAERAGGEIDYILESSAKSIDLVEKLKKERRAVISSLAAQGYIIFLIFIAIVLVMQFKILPLTSNIASFDVFQGDITKLGSEEVPSASLKPKELANNFLYLLITQGIFAGLIIGKLTEGTIKAGVKHSFILASAAFLISTGVRALVSTGASTSASVT